MKDIGVAILDRNDALPADHGFFVPTARKRRRTKGLRVTLSGYPGSDFGRLWEDSGKIRRVRRRVVRYRHWAEGGQSGAPLWRIEGGEARVFAVHSQNYGRREQGVRITSERIAWLERLVAEFG